jgi:hypothetical protein
MNLRKTLLITFSLVPLIGATAFKQIWKSSTINVKKANINYSYWFSYIGPTTGFNFGDLTNPNNYVPLPDEQNPYVECAYGSQAVCTILCERTWNGFEWKPDFSNTSYGSTYWALYNFFSSGIPGSDAVLLKNL